MAANFKLVNVSGTVFGVGSQAVSVTLLVGQSGAVFIPIKVDGQGFIITKGSGT